jgi:hypothetical protein
MKTSELLPLMDRETATLTADNNHSAAALMKAGADTIRALVAASPPEVTAGVRVVELGDLPRLKSIYDGQARPIPGTEFITGS